MSILIKGMEMPKTCDDCRLRCFSLLAKMNCPITGADVTNQQYAKERHPNCPIIEVPTPHGRLIDADEHIKLLKESFCGDRCERNRYCPTCGIDIYIRVVENEPTVIKAEVSEE